MAVNDNRFYKYRGNSVTNLNEMIVRQGEDDFDAIGIANAMQSMAFVDVVSIVHENAPKLTHQDSGHVWHVFAKYAGDMVTTDQIDAKISAMYNERDRQAKKRREST